MNCAFSLSPLLSLSFSLSRSHFFFFLNCSRKYGANHRELNTPPTPRGSRNTPRIHCQQRERDTRCAPTYPHHPTPRSFLTLGAGGGIDRLCMLLQKLAARAEMLLSQVKNSCCCGISPREGQGEERWWW